MVNTTSDRPDGPPMNPDATQGNACNNNASHESKPPFSRSITMSGTTPVAQDKQGESHITGAGPIPFDLGGSPQTTPPPVVVPRIRRRISPIDEETTAQQHGQDSRNAPESLASRKGLTNKSHGGLTLSTASTVVEDAPRESSVIQHVAGDVPSAPAGASSNDPLKTPTKATASANQEYFQLPIRQAKINAVVAEESEKNKEEADKGPQEASTLSKEGNKLPNEADKQPQEVDTTAGATPHPTDASGPSAPSSSTDASDDPTDTPTVAALRAELARLQSENAHLHTTLSAAAAATAEADTHLRYSALHTRALRLAHESRQSSRLADRVHRLGQRQYNRAERLLTLYTRTHAAHAAAVTSGQTWKARAQVAESEVGEWQKRAVEAEGEVEELREWRRVAQGEGEEILEMGRAWEAKAGELERENEELRAWKEGAGEVVGWQERAVRVERERAGKYRRAYEDLKMEREGKEGLGLGQGQGQQGQQGQGQNLTGGGSVAAVAANVVGRINSALEDILEDVYGKEVAKEKMALAGMLEQDPVIYEPLELAMDDENDMEEREKELGVFFKYAHLRAEFVKNAGMDATEDQFNKAMKMEARAREEVRRLGRPRTRSF